MRAFKAFWLCALENNKTSGEDVWRGALEHAIDIIEDSYVDADKWDILDIIRGELNEKAT